MKKSNIILNGKHYDALTGQLLSAPAAKTAKTEPAKTERPRRAVRHVERRVAAHASPHQPKPTKTLMRKAVKKPVRATHIKAHSLAAKPLAKVEVPKSIKRLDTRRLEKASRVKRSQLIRHFSPVAYDYVPAKPKHHAAHKPAHTAKPIAVSPPISATDQLLARAIEKANSHEQQPIKIKRQGRLKRMLAHSR